VPVSQRIHFQQELTRLEEQALGALDLVVATLDRTLEALHHRDIELAGIVIADDDRIDGRYLEVHQGILSLLALQAPVASDLRVVAALLHVIKHAERMGDQCVNIAKLLPISGTEPPVPVGTRSAPIRARSSRVCSDSSTRTGISRLSTESFARAESKSPMVATRTVCAMAAVVTPSRAASSARGTICSYLDRASA